MFPHDNPHYGYYHETNSHYPLQFDNKVLDYHSHYYGSRTTKPLQASLNDEEKTRDELKETAEDKARESAADDGNDNRTSNNNDDDDDNTVPVNVQKTSVSLEDAEREPIQENEQQEEIKEEPKKAKPVDKEYDLQRKVDDLQKELEKKDQVIQSYEKKIQYLMSDYENLKRRIDIDSQNKVNESIDKMMLKFLSIYDDFQRAKESLEKQKVDTQGLNGIIKNMDSFLAEYDIKPLEALGEIFDPNLHEAIATVEDENLDDSTITKELRKGYMIQDRVIRPSLVEISKKPKINNKEYTENETNEE